MATIKYDDDVPVLVHVVNDYSYSFCVKDFPENKYDWLCEIISRHMDTIHKRAVEDTEKSVKLNIRKAIGL